MLTGGLLQSEDMGVLESVGALLRGREDVFFKGHALFFLLRVVPYLVSLFCRSQARRFSSFVCVHALSCSIDANFSHVPKYILRVRMYLTMFLSVSLIFWSLHQTCLNSSDHRGGIYPSGVDRWCNVLIASEG